MDYQIKQCIPASHPSLPGHFPGNPIVPAVVILDEVLNALLTWQVGVEVLGINTVKFVAPLKPEETFTIQLEQSKPDLVKFECFTIDRKLATGQLSVKSDGT